MGCPRRSHQRQVRPRPARTPTIFPPTGGGTRVGADSGRASESRNPSARPLLPPGRPRRRRERGAGEGQAGGNSRRVLFQKDDGQVSRSRWRLAQVLPVLDVGRRAACALASYPRRHADGARARLCPREDAGQAPSGAVRGEGPAGPCERPAGRDVRLQTGTLRCRKVGAASPSRRLAWQGAGFPPRRVAPEPTSCLSWPRPPRSRLPRAGPRHPRPRPPLRALGLTLRPASSAQRVRLRRGSRSGREPSLWPATRPSPKAGLALGASYVLEMETRRSSLDKTVGGPNTKAGDMATRLSSGFPTPFHVHAL